MTTHRNIDDIRAELAAAERAEAAKLESRRNAVKPSWLHTVTPVDDSWHEVYDDTIKLYSIEGQVINRHQCLDAGHPEYAIRGGKMTYVYNTVTHKLVCAIGGGTTFIIGSIGHNKNRRVADTMDSIGAFIAARPAGGDITEIIELHKALVWADNQNAKSNNN